MSTKQPTTNNQQLATSTTLKDNLSTAIAHAVKFVGKDTTLPILSHILIKTDDSRLKVQATNLESSFTTWIGAKNVGDFAVALPAKTLTDVVNVSPAGEITLTYDPRTVTITLKSGGFKSDIKGIDPEEFPIIPSVGDGYELGAFELSRAIATTAFAASTEDERPILTGINITRKEDHLIFAATDGYRLAKSELFARTTQPLNIIVPSVALQRLNDIIKRAAVTDHVTMSLVNDNAIGFKNETCEIVATLLEGNYPDYGAIIPTAPTTTVSAVLGDIIRACNAADIFARENAHTIRFKCRTLKPDASGNNVFPAGIEIESQSAEVGSHHSFTYADVTGEDVEIAFNVKYLAQHLRAIESLTIGKDAKVQMEFGAPQTPGVFKPTDVAHTLHVIMPMRLGK